MHKALHEQQDTDVSATLPMTVASYHAIIFAFLNHFKDDVTLIWLNAEIILKAHC